MIIDIAGRDLGPADLAEVTSLRADGPAGHETMTEAADPSSRRGAGDVLRVRLESNLERRGLGGGLCRQEKAGRMNEAP